MEQAASEAARQQNVDMGLDCYTFELFDQAKALDEHQIVLFDALTARGDVAVRRLAADLLSQGGNG